MSDTYSPPSMPPPSNSDKKLRIFAVVFFVAAVLFLGVIIGASGDSKPAANETTATVSVTNAPIAADPAQTKYDRYYENVLNNSGRANSLSKSAVIEVGDLVCQSLDEGNTTRQVAIVLEGASSTQSELEYAAAVMYWAITDLCPEYKASLNAYLNS